MQDDRKLSPLLARMMARIDAVDWKISPKLKVARCAVIDLARGDITHDDAIGLMLAVGYDADQAQRIIQENTR